MLTLQSIRDPFESRATFNDFDPERETWIVSDLKSKLDLNRRLLAARPFLAGESVLRVSDFWKLLLTRLRPDLQVVSREFMITLITQKITRRESASGEEWIKSPGVAQAAYDYMTQLMPVLAHPNGREMLEEWFGSQPASEARWGRWFQLALELWREFLADGFIAPAWASGVLVNESWAPGGEIWSRPLVVDLGPDLDQVEADLLVQLSSIVDVRVLRPEPAWGAEFRKALSAYEVFGRKLKVNFLRGAVDGPRPTRPRRYHKYTTMIAEVKDAVAEIRGWLDRGEARPAQIAVVAPDIEVYWPALGSYLGTEGIPCQKNRVRRLHSFPDIARWLANLRLRTSSFSEADLELALFDGGPRMLKFEEFKIYYSSLYGREDLERKNEVGKKFAVDLSAGDEPIRDEFVSWSLKFLPPNAEVARVERLFKRLFQDCPQAQSLPLARWLAFVEQLAGKTECPVAEGNAEGISCVSLTSAENSPATHMIMLGLTEGALKSPGSTAILASDIASIENQLGFYLAGDERGSLEFLARWVLSDPERELLLSVPETDFAGGAQAPAWMWIQGARGDSSAASVRVPSPTRWDELQYAELSRIIAERAWGEPHANQLNQALSADFGMQEPAPFGSDLVTALSPSAIEDYLDCPFVFAAKRLFALTDVAELDLEVDAIRRGNLMHSLFESLTVEPRRFDFTDAELNEILERARVACDLKLADERLWPALKGRHLDLARRFLAFEKEERLRFPGSRTIAREMQVSGYIDPGTGAMMSASAPGLLKFSGRIDRVDADTEGNLIIYDYKSSVSSTAQFGTWIKNNQIQLLLYALAIEAGLAEIGPRKVLAALYYVARPLGKDFGFKTEDVLQGLYDCGDRRKKNRISAEGREKLFEEARLRVVDAISGIYAGRFHPQPRDQKNCQDCKWSSLCRAPHLN